MGTDDFQQEGSKRRELEGESLQLGLLRPKFEAFDLLLTTMNVPPMFHPTNLQPANLQPIKSVRRNKITTSDRGIRLGVNPNGTGAGGSSWSRILKLLFIEIIWKSSADESEIVTYFPPPSDQKESESESEE